MRPRLEKLLGSVSEKIMDAGCRGITKECDRILKDAESAVEEVRDGAYAMKGMQSSSAWGDALTEYLPRITSLIKRGPTMNGPQEAWKGLLVIARLSMHDWERGDPDVQEGEDANDRFHDMVDDGLLAVCKQMQEHKMLDWLRDNRAEEVWTLQEQPSEPCRYRYQQTLGFLGQLSAS